MIDITLMINSMSKINIITIIAELCIIIAALWFAISRLWKTYWCQKQIAKWRRWRRDGK